MNTTHLKDTFTAAHAELDSLISTLNRGYDKKFAIEHASSLNAHIAAVQREHWKIVRAVGEYVNKSLKDGSLSPQMHFGETYPSHIGGYPTPTFTHEGDEDVWGWLDSLELELDCRCNEDFGTAPDEPEEDFLNALFDEYDGRGWDNETVTKAYALGKHLAWLERTSQGKTPTPTTTTKE